MRLHQGLNALDARLSALRGQPFMRPPRGWLRAIRDSLGMTAAQYAERLGVSQPRITALEQGEVAETVTLATLRRAAEALDCQLVYAIIPKVPLAQMVRDRAELAADAQLARTSHTMRLENQAITESDAAHEKERLIKSYIEGDLRRLWDEP